MFKFSGEAIAVIYILDGSTAGHWHPCLTRHPLYEQVHNLRW